jgi:ABC-2 type transport system permease protein
MWAVLRQALGRGWGQVLGWGLSLAVLAGYLMKFFDVFAQQQESMLALLESYPKELVAFFGDMANMFTPAGFLHVELFSYLPLVLGIQAILGGSGLLAADEESGVMDLVLAHPVSRWALFAGRLAGFLAVLAGILALCWAGMLIGQRGTSIAFSALELARPFASLSALLLWFAALALLLSMLLPSRRLAGMTTGLILVGGFFLDGLGRIDDRLAEAARWSPLHYYQGGEALNGLNWAWVAGLLIAAGLMVALAGWLFARRDIRVAGEGSWRWFTRRARPA